MNLDKIEKLVKIIEESSLQEFSIQEGDIKIKMSKRAGESIAVPFAPGMGMRLQELLHRKLLLQMRLLEKWKKKHTLLPRSSEHFTPHLHRKLKLS